MSSDLRVLEIGCGTGLLSFTLAPHVHSLLGVDTAEGMISAFHTKLQDLEKPNLMAINHLLTNPDSPEMQSACTALEGGEATSGHRFDLVVSHLTLHHIENLEGVFETMFKCLRKGGVVALTDYEDFGKEAIRFHPVKKRPGVEHHGIKKDVARELLVKAGFEDVKIDEAFVLRKEVEDEEGMKKLMGEMAFPFLMVYGVKR
jgi:SAM-dependent methyltransferase